MYVCMYVCMYVSMYVCVYVCMYGWMDACMDACMYLCIYVLYKYCISCISSNKCQASNKHRPLISPTPLGIHTEISAPC